MDFDDIPPKVAELINDITNGALDAARREKRKLDEYMREWGATELQTEGQELDDRYPGLLSAFMLGCWMPLVKELDEVYGRLAATIDPKLPESVREYLFRRMVIDVFLRFQMVVDVARKNALEAERENGNEEEDDDSEAN